MRQIAISDIHGCSRTFRALLDKVHLSKSDELFLLGDYIDRGPDSRGVIDLIFSLKEQGHKVSALMGNHEDLLLNALKNSETEPWLRNGGGTTLKSFGAASPDEIPAEYPRFIKALKYYQETENYFLVHAGLNFSLSDPLQDTYSMIWIRDMKPDIGFLKGRSLVHGHSPLPMHMIEQTAHSLEINIDAGCVYTGYPEYGYLCAFDMTARKFYFQRNIDDFQ